MKLKKIKLLVIIFLFLNSYALSSDIKSVKIIFDVEDKIVTNLDINKEINYLKLLNPNINQLNNEQLIILSKESLIKEIIKERELLKFTNISLKEDITKKYLMELIKKLGYENLFKFKEVLKKETNYSIKEIEKKITIELIWNDFIYSKYNDQININEKKLKKRLEALKGKKTKEYLLSEILIKKKQNQSIDSLNNEIFKKIEEIGFPNTANLYSVSDTSKTGGKLGWINEKNLPKLINDQLKNLKEGEITNLIKVNNNYLLLRIEQIKNTSIQIDEKKEFQKLIEYERNKQFEQFSRIYFEKMKINYDINEK